MMAIDVPLLQYFWTSMLDILLSLHDFLSLCQQVMYMIPAVLTMLVGLKPLVTGMNLRFWMEILKKNACEWRNEKQRFTMYWLCNLLLGLLTCVSIPGGFTREKFTQNSGFVLPIGYLPQLWAKHSCFAFYGPKISQQTLSWTILYCEAVPEKKNKLLAIIFLLMGTIILQVILYFR